MLRFFFFVMAYLTDYRSVAEALRSGATLGLANAAMLCFIGAWLALRGWRTSGNHQGRDVRGSAAASNRLA